MRNKRLQVSILSTSTLVRESEKQLDNIAEILKAFPDAKIKIGGYAHATGDAAVNKKVSQDRADIVKNSLDKIEKGLFIKWELFTLLLSSII